MAVPDYYALLGVDPDATTAQITRAWRQLVLISHPDKQASRTPTTSTSNSTSTSRTPSPSASPSPSTSGNPDHTADIRLLNEARAVLSDPDRRAAFDKDLSARSVEARLGVPAKGPRIREYVSLEEFTPHYANGGRGRGPGREEDDRRDTQGEDEEGDEEEPEKYTLECRCGQDYTITLADLEAGVDVVGCPGCGEYIGVEYEEVEE